jgi:hypothetical protein|nr:MAG TPA: hypothetical protein [Caudoviricetes sp.]
MGLDMYLYKAEKLDENVTLEDILLLNDYFDWKEYGQKYTFEKWCGKDIKKVKRKLIPLYKNEYKEMYWDWDTEHKYCHRSLLEQLVSWRKANQIHNWFVENVQDGKDDCGCYEVTKGQLEELLDTCIKVKAASKLVKGKVNNGYTFKDGVEIPNVEDGKYIEDPTTAMELLPAQSGFFFGSTDYDQWYMSDIDYTIEKILKVLKTTDFDKEIVFYRSSW